MAQTVGEGGYRPTSRQRKKITMTGRRSQDMGVFEDTRDNAPRQRPTKNIVRRAKRRK